MTQQDIQRRLDQILTEWIKANPEQRGRLLKERLQLEQRLDNLKRQVRDV